MAVKAKDTQLKLQLLRLTGGHSVHLSDPGDSATDPLVQDMQLSASELPV